MNDTLENIEFQLTSKQRNFVNLLVNGRTQREAFIEAGYKAKSETTLDVNASKLLSNCKVSKYLELQRNKLQKAIETKTEVSVLKTVSELARVGYCDPIHLFDDDGKLKEIKDIEENTRRAISSIEVKEEYDRDGKYTGSNTKVKFWNKNEALKTIATYLGILVERHEVNGTLVVKELKDLPKSELLKLAEMQSIDQREN